MLVLPEPVSPTSATTWNASEPEPVRPLPVAEPMASVVAAVLPLYGDVTPLQLPAAKAPVEDEFAVGGVYLD